MVIPEERSMDFEWTRAEFRDEYSKNWLTESGRKDHVLCDDRRGTLYTRKTYHADDHRKDRRIFLRRYRGFPAGHQIKTGGGGYAVY